MVISLALILVVVYYLIFVHKTRRQHFVILVVYSENNTKVNDLSKLDSQAITLTVLYAPD